ncbi:MAG TPA: GyrI-like domain-containing protein [Nocardioides sp.]|nr:GyrI-like domain-containing protein [Nocardioides sp.]
MTDLAPPEPHERGARVELDPVPLAVVRRDGVVLDDVRDLFDEGYAALGRLLGDGTLVPVGPALAIYRGDVTARFDLELGFPVAEAPGSPIRAGDLEVVGTTLPAGPALAATHLGAYDDLGDAWARLADTPGASHTNTWIEVYVVDPSSDPDHLRTDLLMPVRD